MKKNFKVVKELESLINTYESLFLKNISPSKKNDEIFICAYFLTALEYVHGICVLIKEDNFISIEPLFRSLLETIVDISNLCNHQDYYLYLQREQHKRDVKRYEKWNKYQDNDFFPNTDSIGDEFKEIIRASKGKIKEINSMGFTFTNEKSKTLEISEKFKIAKIENVHSSIWDLVSSAIHNDLLNISKRHIIEKEDGQIIITKRGKFSIESLSAHLVTIPGLLYSALGEIYKRFNLDSEKLKQLYEEKNKKLQKLLEIEDD